MQKVLLTGGAGFLGSHIAERLIANGYTVVVVDDLSGGKREQVPTACRFVKGDVCDTQLMRSLFKEHRFEYVFHLAAYAAENRSHEKRVHTFRNNTLASAGLIELAVEHEVRCFVFTSSIAVYGDQGTAVSEKMVPQPVDPYGIAKYATELDLRTAQVRYGLNHIIFRPHNVYGERQNLNDPDRNVVGIFMRQALQGTPLTIYGDGSQSRAFTYVGDISEVMARSISMESVYNRTFNLGSNTRCSVLELATKLSKGLAIPLQVKHLPERHEVKHIAANHDLATKYFDDLQSTSLEDGLIKMANWAKENVAVLTESPS